MGTRRSDPTDKRRQTLLRQASGQTEKYGIGGIEKSGQHAPRKVGMPKMPWENDDGREGNQGQFQPGRKP